MAWALAVALTGASLAAPRVQAQGLLGGLGGAGLYIGAQLGFERAEYSVTESSQGAVLAVSDNERNFVGGVLAGVEFPVVSPFYVAVEGYWDGRTVEIGNFTNEHRVGVRGLIGYQLARVVDLFVLAGPQWAQIRLPARSATASGVTVSTPGRNEFALGFSVGFGARYSVTPNWLVRAQYSYAQAETDFGVTVEGGQQDLSFSPDATNRSHSLTAGFTYMF